MKRRVVSLAGVVAVVIGGVWSGVGAQPASQGLEVVVPTPPKAATPELGLKRTMPLEERGIREQDFYPGLIRSRHEPAFVTPFVATIPTSRSSGVRLGLSGWTAPAVPFDIPQATGGLAFGFTLVWGVPLTETAPPPPEPPSQR